jgi:hypothetical protein
MRSEKVFARKIVYLALIAVLLLMLFLLSQPATNAVKGVPGSPGGMLARLRDKYKLNPAQLGQIDPTSVTIKLATLGLRGVAANLLWEKANEYQMKKDWANRAATLKQITKVQPHFINVWINQAWNVSYNISVQFRDDYRERYRWVIKGFDFLKEGMSYNAQEPKLQYEMGRMISQKIGKADESKQFRKLFKQDDDFHGDRPMAERDNWLVGKEWYDIALEMAATLPKGIIGQTPVVYCASGPLCLMYYAEALEKEGTFGEVAKAAWMAASNEWRRFGDKELPTHFTRGPNDPRPLYVRLNDQELEENEAKAMVAKLDALQPGLREKIVAEKRAKLTKAQREAISIPEEKRTANQIRLATEANETLWTTNDEVARRITGPRRTEAIEMARKIAEHQLRAQCISSNRGIANFPYWDARAKSEQDSTMLKARQLIFRGDQKSAEGELQAARDAYEEGFRAWRRALDGHREYVKDLTVGEDLMDAIKRYRRVLGQLDERFPEPFILQDLIDAQNEMHGGAKGRMQTQQKSGKK